MLIINILKKIFGVKFLRTVSAIIYPVKSGIKNRILKFWRLMGFPWRAKKGLLALGERVDYSFPKDWIRIDWQASDFDINLKEFSMLPFSDNSFQAVYSAHVFEHLGYKAVSKVLSECYRILKPGGKIRIEVPDADLFVAAYLKNDENFLEGFIAQAKSIVERFDISHGNRYQEKHMVVMNCLSHSYPKIYGRNSILPSNVCLPKYVDKEIFDTKLKNLERKDFYAWASSLQNQEELETGGHQCGFNFKIMKDLLEKEGFKKINKMEYGKSSYNVFGVTFKSHDSGIKEKTHRNWFSLYVEAEK